MNLLRDDKKFVWKFNLSALKELVINGLIREIHFPSDGPAFEGDTFFIHGEQSDFVRDQDKDEIVKLFPKARFYSIPDGGHYLHVEKPKEFLNILVSCLVTTKETEKQWENFS